ncbi:MAG: hypothetical protein ACP5HU_07370 [Phycisphaerae bacterium]
MDTVPDGIPCLNTTRISSLWAVQKQLGFDYSATMLFGASGTAFVVNIHPQLCPSGPYCWGGPAFDEALGNLGIVRTDLGFLGEDSTAEQRRAVEQKVRDTLAAGRPATCLNNEHQYITGTNETGFTLIKCWPNNVTSDHLTFTSWDEWDDWHASFQIYDKAEPADLRTIFADSIALAIELYENPEAHAFDGYSIGPRAYDTWIKAVRDGHAADHGNWWNATVYAEGRNHAANYCREIARELPDTGADANMLAELYAELAETLDRVSDKDLSGDTRTQLLTRAAELEAAALPHLKAVHATLTEATGSRQ